MQFAWFDYIYLSSYKKNVLYVQKILIEVKNIIKEIKAIIDIVLYNWK